MWDTLLLKNKDKIIKQVVQHLLAAFQLRFDRAGSLYLAHSTNTQTLYFVGPIITSTFFQVQDGLLLYSDQMVFRGFEDHSAIWPPGYHILLVLRCLS
jgi:hypothetical protein